MKHQKLIFFTLGLVAGLILGAAGMSILKNTKSTSSETAYEGKVICLPHKDMTGPQTMECAGGLRTNDNKTYALSSDQLMTELIGAAGSDKKVKVTGNLRTDVTSIYQVDGSITVSRYEFLK